MTVDITKFAERLDFRSDIALSGWDFGQAGRPVALLHHANGLCGACWLEVAQLLSHAYHVIAIDARGHGDSEGIAEGLTTPTDFAWASFVDDLIVVAECVVQMLDVKTIHSGVGSSFGG